MSIEHCFSIWPFGRFQKMLIKRILTPLKIRKNNQHKFNIFKRVNGSMDFRNLCKSFERRKLHITRYYHHCTMHIINTNGVLPSNFHPLFFDSLRILRCCFFFPNTNENNWKCFGSKAPFDANRLTNFNQRPAAF